MRRDPKWTKTQRFGHKRIQPMRTPNFNNNNKTVVSGFIFSPSLSFSLSVSFSARFIQSETWKLPQSARLRSVIPNYLCFLPSALWGGSGYFTGWFICFNGVDSTSGERSWLVFANIYFWSEFYLTERCSFWWPTFDIIHPICLTQSWTRQEITGRENVFRKFEMEFQPRVFSLL